MVLPHIGKPRLLGEARGHGRSRWCRAGITGTNSSMRRWARERPPRTFGYAGPLTESVLLGRWRRGSRRRRWSGMPPALKFTNVAEANKFVRRAYRAGFETAGLST